MDVATNTTTRDGTSGRMGREQRKWKGKTKRTLCIPSSLDIYEEPTGRRGLELIPR